MKRLLLIFLTILCATTCWAKGLATESLFCESTYKNKAVKVTIITKKNSEFRSIRVRGDASLVSKMESAVKKDRAKAASITESYSNGGETYDVIFGVNGITVIFTKRGNDHADLSLSEKSDSSD